MIFTDNMFYQYHSVVLQIGDITNKKAEMLRDMLLKATKTFNKLFEFEQERKRYNNDIYFSYAVFYSKIKNETNFNSDILNNFRRKIKAYVGPLPLPIFIKPENSVYQKTHKVKGVTVIFHVNRTCKIFSTKAFTFLEIRPYTKSKAHSGTKIAIPVKMDSNWEKYKTLIDDGWECNAYGITPNLKIVAYLRKKDETVPRRPNVLGIDINAKNFAITVLSSTGKVLHQDYFGKDVWIKRKKFLARRNKLIAYANNGSERAKKYLRKLQTKEQNFVKNRIGEIARDITNMALKYNADIAIERLSFNPKDKNFARENMRLMGLTSYAFKNTLSRKCFHKNIHIDYVSSWHTSRFCSHCGAVGRGHDSENYVLFKCKKCGLVVNSDRNASKNIALKSLLERDILNPRIFQISNRRVPVNGLVRPNEF